MKFKLLSGTHQINSKTYNPGDTIRTRRRLDKHFPNRFAIVDETTEEEVSDKRKYEQNKISRYEKVHKGAGRYKVWDNKISEFLTDLVDKKEAVKLINELIKTDYESS